MRRRLKSGDYGAIIADRAGAWLVPRTQPRSRAPANLSRSTGETPFSKAPGMLTEPIRRADSRLRSDGQPLSSPARNPTGESESSDATVESVVRGGERCNRKINHA